MNFGEAWENAGAIITLLALLPAFGLLLMMTQNMTNSEFDMVAAFETSILLISDAILPVFGATIVLALILYIGVNASGRSSGR